MSNLPTFVIMAAKSDNKNITIRPKDKSLKEALMELAAKDNRSLNGYILILLNNHIKKAKK